MKKKRKTQRRSHLDVAHGHVLQHPDPMGPGVVVAGISTGGVAAHLHLLVEGPGQMVAELLAPLAISWLGFALLLPPAAALGGALLQDLLQHPASAGRQHLLS